MEHKLRSDSFIHLQNRGDIYMFTCVPLLILEMEKNAKVDFQSNPKKVPPPPFRHTLASSALLFYLLFSTQAHCSKFFFLQKDQTLCNFTMVARLKSYFYILLTH